MTSQQLAHGEREDLDQWDVLDERLGLPGNPRADQRVAELTANGWQFVGVMFRTGTWRFRRPKHD